MVANLLNFASNPGDISVSNRLKCVGSIADLVRAVIRLLPALHYLLPLEDIGLAMLDMRQTMYMYIVMWLPNLLFDNFASSAITHREGD